MENGNVAEVTYLKVHIFFNLADRQKRNNLYPPPLDYMLSVKFGGNWMKIVGAVTI